MKLIFLFLITLSAFLRIQVSDFSGVWIIDQGKSQYEHVLPGKGAPPTLSIHQTRDSIMIVRTLDSKIIRTETYSLDGTGVYSKIDSMTEKTSSCTWSGDGKMLIIRSKYKIKDGRNWESLRTDVFKLSDDKNALTMERVNILPDRTERIIAVYNRK